jgi:hypothetical protein
VRDDITDFPDLHRMLSAYETVVLVANSEQAQGSGFERRWPGRTLYIFFNDARRVLQPGFDHDAVLVLRSGKEGPSVIRRHRLDAVARQFAAGRLKAIVNLVVDTTEQATDLAEQGGRPIQLLDLTAYFAKRYTGGKIPSSGYALALWLSDQRQAPVVLCGFNALRSENWKVFDIHDWAFEQTSLRLAERSGRVAFEPNTHARPTALEALEAQHPNTNRTDLLAVHAETLAGRLEHTNLFVDRLWSVTRVNRFLRTLLRFGR